MTKHATKSSDRASRKRHSASFGVEVAREVIWEAWEPGGEYTREIKLKNVNIKTQKIKYRIPSSRFFSMQYPQPIVLSSGTSTHLNVTFKPLKKGQYDDFVEFITKEGSFKVALTAVVPDARLKLPNTVEFGMCAVHDSIEQEFEVLNTSDVHTAFQFQATAPFSIKPASGTLAPRTQCIIKAIFNPTDALVYELDATCRLSGGDEEIQKVEIIKLEGIGKRPHLLIGYGKQSSDKQTLIDFESVGIGFSAVKTFNIINSTPVSAPFQIVQPSLSTTLDSVFSVSTHHGTIPPSASCAVTLNFQPLNGTGTRYVDNFEVIAVGATSKAAIKCTGTGEGPCVNFETDSIHFGVASVGEEVSRSFKLRNASNIPAVFQFQMDVSHGTFHLNCVSGVLAANSTQMIIVNFRPMKPIAYYRNLTCLIHNQGPISLELIGTCHTKEVQPVVLSRTHVQTSLVNMSRGFSWYPPEHLEELLKQGKLSVCEADNTLVALDEKISTNLEAPHPTDLCGYEGYFFGETIGGLTSGMPHISMDVTGVNFGRCANIQTYQKTINVTNHTHGRVSCIWMNDDSSEFSVEPNEIDIQPQSTVSFKVLFRPLKMSQFSSVELEGYVFYKTQRDHRLFDERMLTLPWCITSVATGHTFPKHCETYLPVCTWDQQEMVFPPQVNMSESLYRTCLLTNNGDTPILFNFEEDHTGVFSCKPSHGLLREKYQMIVFQMLPQQVGITSTTIKCCINDAEKYSKEFQLTVSSEVAQVSLQPDDMIYFKPTCIHATSTQTTSIKNLSRMPLRFEWIITEVDEPNLQVSPKSGVILANEIQEHEWRFTPGIVTKYLFKIKLLVYNDKGNSKPQKYFAQLIGEGQMGSIKCSVEKHAFGNIIVGSKGRHSMELKNESDCDLLYQLSCNQKFVQHITSEQVQVDNILTLGHSEGLVLAHSSSNVDLTVAPRHHGFYECDISYELRPFSGKLDEKVFVGEDEFTAKGHLYTVTVEGVYPLLRAVDVHGGGCATLYSKQFLWNLLSLTHFNALLSADPSPKELKYSIETRHSTRRRMPETTDARCNFDFGSAACGSRSCEFLVVLENSGSDDIEWAFRYPTDLQLEMDYWADNGVLEEDELHEMYIMDSKLFSVEPKTGKVKRGQTQQVKFTYRHESVGVHRLPVLLKIVQGREILINFLGTTTSPGSARLHFASLRHRFVPVAVGNRYPPVQLYQLCNGSDTDIEFQMDLMALDELQRDNYDWRVLECLQPYGYIRAGECAQIQWIFSPLEAKEYEVSIPISVNGGETTIVSFACAGEHPGSEDDHHSGGPLLKPAVEDVEPYLRTTHEPFLEEDQPIKLSQESIAFGGVPLFCRESRMIFVENLLDDHIVSYQWLITGTDAEGVIEIKPQSGFLQPREVLPCQIVVLSEGPPAMNNFDIILEATDESLMEKFNIELMHWHKKKEEHEHLFIIHEQSTAKKAEKAREAAEKQRPGSGKYEVLPPVKSVRRPPTDEKSVKKEIEQRLNKEVVNEQCTFNVAQPRPPMPYISHLGITASTEPVSDFYNKSLEDMQKHFIQGMPPEAVQTSRTPRKSYIEELAPAQPEELNAINSIVGSIIKDVLEDEDFRDSLKELQQEPIPYFGMMRLAEEEAPSVRMNESVEMMDVSAEETPRAASAPSETTPRSRCTTGMTAARERGIATAPAEHCVAEVKSEEDFYGPRQALKCLHESRGLLHDILENTITNLMNEASLEEISLTSRPRLIALPPVKRPMSK